MKELTTEIKQYELSENKASQLESTFLPMLDMLKPMEKEFNEIVSDAEKCIDEDVTARAKRLRLDIGKVRIETEKKRKVEKNESLRLGKAIDGIASVVKYAVTSKEEKLKDIETHLERIEIERLKKIAGERLDLVSKYIDADLMAGTKLAEMDQDVFDAYLSAKKTAFENAIADEKARVEAGEEAKAEREAEEKRIREENAKLRADAEKAEQAEKDRIDAIKKADDDKKRLEDKHAAELKELANSSSEITMKEIERAKSEGKAVFVKILRIENDCKESGIFITKD